MLTVLPDNLLLSKPIGLGWSIREAIRVGRVNKELHARTLDTVKGHYADRLKRFWDRCQKCWSTTLLVERFRACKLNAADIAAMEFGVFVKHLQTKRVVRSTKKLVERLNYYVLHVVSKISDITLGEPKKASVRVFIASYMLRYAGDRCIEDREGVLESTVLRAANVLVACFEELCDTVLLAAGDGRGVKACFQGGRALVEFPDVTVRFYTAFEAWRNPNAALLTARIAATLETIRRYERLIPADVPADNAERLECSEQIAALRLRLLSVDGDTGVALFAQDVWDQLERLDELEAGFIGGEDHDEQDDEQDDDHDEQEDDHDEQEDDHDDQDDHDEQEDDHDDQDDHAEHAALPILVWD